jgi:hypothetical protein
MFPRFALSLGLAGLLVLAGCSTAVKEEQIKVDASNDPLHEPRQILGRYAQGQPMSSEASMFPAMVENVRKTDPASADILEKGLDDLQKAAPAARPGKAKELLSKIQPQAYPKDMGEEPKS